MKEGLRNAIEGDSPNASVGGGGFIICFTKRFMVRDAQKLFRKFTKRQVNGIQSIAHNAIEGGGPKIIDPIWIFFRGEKEITRCSVCWNRRSRGANFNLYQAMGVFVMKLLYRKEISAI